MRDEYLNTRDRQTFQILLITAFGVFVWLRAGLDRQAMFPDTCPRFLHRPAVEPDRASVRPSICLSFRPSDVVWDYTDVCVVALRLQKETPERAEC